MFRKGTATTVSVHVLVTVAFDFVQHIHFVKFWFVYIPAVNALSLSLSLAHAHTHIKKHTHINKHTHKQAHTLMHTRTQ